MQKKLSSSNYIDSLYVKMNLQFLDLSYPPGALYTLPLRVTVKSGSAQLTYEYILNM